MMPKTVSNIERYNRSLTDQQRREHQQKAGVASGKARRRYRAMRDTLGQFMDRTVSDEAIAESLQKLGLDPSVANAVGFSLVKRAVAGEVTAVRFLRDTLEEKQPEENRESAPVRSMDLSRLTDEQLAELADREEGPDG